MSDSNSLGCMWVVVLGVALILFASAAFGAPVVSSMGLAWDNSAAIARTNARVEMNRQDNITRRQESENWHETAQQAAVIGGVVGVVGLVVWAVQRSVTAWAARPHRPAPAPPQVIVMLAAPELEAAPEAYLGYNDDNKTWAVVNPRTGIVKRLEERPPTRQIAQRRG